MLLQCLLLQARTPFVDELMLGKTALRFVADQEDSPATTDATAKLDTGAPKTVTQTKTFTAKKSGETLVLIINDGTGEKSFKPQAPCSTFTSFNFDGKAHIDLNPFAPQLLTKI